MPCTEAWGDKVRQFFSPSEEICLAGAHMDIAITQIQILACKRVGKPVRLVSSKGLLIWMNSPEFV